MYSAHRIVRTMCIVLYSASSLLLKYVLYVSNIVVHLVHGVLNRAAPSTKAATNKCTRMWWV